MCGIIGFTGNIKAQDILLTGLEKLLRYAVDQNFHRMVSFSQSNLRIILYIRKEIVKLIYPAS